MNNNAENQIEMIIEPGHDEYDRNDQRWIQQINQLYSDLNSELGTVRKDVTPQEGQKGGLESIIIALGSAGVITAAVEIIKAWLGRDRGRHITFKAKVGEEVQELSISGQGMNASQIEKFMREAMKKSGPKN